MESKYETRCGKYVMNDLIRVNKRPYVFSETVVHSCLGDNASVRIVVERWRASVRRIGKTVLNDLIQVTNGCDERE